MLLLLPDIHSSHYQKILEVSRFSYRWQRLRMGNDVATTLETCTVCLATARCIENARTHPEITPTYLEITIEVPTISNQRLCSNTLFPDIPVGSLPQQLPNPNKA